MQRVELKVPYAEKDEAKRLGARWDAGRKVWYVPTDVDAALFKKWFPELPDFNVRAHTFSIIRSRTTCWKCGDGSFVFTFLLPPGHEFHETYQDDDSTVIGAWVQMDEPCVLHYVEYVPVAVADRMRALTRNYFVDFSKTTNSSYWMNHCEQCRVKQGDFMMHCEPGGAFFPMTEFAAEGMVLYDVALPIEARASYSYGLEFIELMERR